MKKRFVVTAVLTSVILASCNIDPAGRESRLDLSFAEPLSSPDTRAGVAADSNSFILSIAGMNGETVYKGAYGSRPAGLTLKSGTYEVSVVSQEFVLPAFEKPQYGDSQIVLAANGEPVRVAFLCRMTNAGIRISLTDAFKAKYPAGILLLKQDAGSLAYTYSESRTGYFKAGDVGFYYVNGGSETPLFNRQVNSGERHSLTLNASSEESASGFSIKVDTTTLAIVEMVTVGQEYAGADGSSAQKAMSISQAASHPGDTLWVWGYIVGGDLTTSSVNFDGPFEKSSNMAIAASASERRFANCFPVELSKAAVKNALNLVDNPGNLGKRVCLKGKVATYFGLTGLKSVSEFELGE
ncbi:MAG: DUF4493 domain-containing protein [Bacteroidales bacterium]|nr:DUF4493 domain-containing protein [Bacteroidales bacterium]